MPSKDLLAQKSDRLFRLVESVRRSVARGLSTSAYPASTKEFLNYIKLACEVTEACLSKDGCGVQAASDEEETEYTVTLLNQAWLTLHDYIKPVIDAHALSTPYPLIQLINSQVRQIPGFEHANVIIGVTPRFNYFQHQHSGIRALHLNLKSLILGWPEYPERIGFISMPFSRAHSLFCNVLLYHELGHFIFEELSLSTNIIAKLKPLVTKAFSPRITDERSIFWLTTRAGRWMEELFADVLAVRMIGPAYAYAMAEQTRLLSQGDETAVSKFAGSHPCDALRFRLQMGILSEDGWQMEALHHNEASDYLVDLAKKREYSPSDDVPDVIETPLVGIITENTDLVRALVEGIDVPRMRGASFQAGYEVVSGYLAHGIVPAASFEGSSNTPKPIDPAVILNAGVLFQLQDMERLYAHIDPLYCDPSMVADRARMEERIEMWVAKGIEDSFLLADRARA